MVGLSSIASSKYETVDSPTASWAGIGLNLLAKTTIRLKVKYAGDMTNVKLVAQVGEEAPIEITEFEDLGSGQYYVYFDAMRASQLSSPLYFKICDGDTAISNTMRYSVESYASTKLDAEDVGAVVSAMMKYGKAAVTYNETD